MTTRHTKGPWHTNGQTVTAKADWKLIVAICPSTVDPCPTADAAAKSHEEAQANAKLIAAAPMMYLFVASKAACGDKEAMKIIQEITNANA